MSYNKHTWATGNVVGAVDLNRMEQGIEDAGSGQVLVVTDTDGTLDKTWQEIYDAFPNVYIVNGIKKAICSSMTYDSGGFYVTLPNGKGYRAELSTDYPEYKIPK